MKFADNIKQFSQFGYTVVRRLFNASEVHNILTSHVAMNNERHREEIGEKNTDVDNAALIEYPRILKVHHLNSYSRRLLIDPRIHDILVKLMGVEPCGIDAMFYFNPPKSHGQVLHRDHYYIRSVPGTSCGLWIALDDCDEENGCLRVVPGSHVIPIPDAESAKVDVPEGMCEVPVAMHAGDALFFSGNIIHGCLPNSSNNRFRRTFIAHYVPCDTVQTADEFSHAVRFDGSELILHSV